MEQSLLLQEDVKWCLTRLPKAVVTMLETEKEKLILAGGFIRACIAHENISDVDLFSKSKSDAELFARRYKGEKGRILETRNAYTVIERSKVSVQFIHRWTFNDAVSMLNSFDFTIARAAIYFDGNMWHGICDARFYPDLAAKRLVYCSPVRIEEAGGSLLRVLKFYQRGYRIPLESLAKTIARLCSAVHYDKLEGDATSRSCTVEQHHAFVLNGLLREVDPAINPTDRAYFPDPEIQEEEPVELT